MPLQAHVGVKIRYTLAIAEYLNKITRASGLLPADRAEQARCLFVCDEMCSGFSTLHASLPMNPKAQFQGFKNWSREQGDIDRIVSLWRESPDTYCGPFLFGEQSLADAMHAPVVTRCCTYDVKLNAI